MSASSPTEPARSRDEPAGPEQSEDVGTSGDRQRGSWAAPGASGLAGPAAPEQDDDTPEDPLRHRLLTRIPGLSRLAEQSGWMGGSSDDAATQDDGWVYHEGDGDSFQGWLYHYADGTMVDPDGVEYAFPDTSAGDQPASEPVKVEPEAVAEATAEPDAEPDEAPAPGAEVDAAPSAEAEAEPEPEPAADVEPEAEAKTEAPPEAASEAPSEAPSEAEPEPRPDLILVGPPPADADATADADAAIETESEDETEPDAAEPDAAEPVAAESAAREPKPAEPEPQHAAELPAGVPRFVEYTPTHVRGYLLGGVFVLASVAAVLTLFVAVSESSVAALVIAGGCVVLAVVAWWALLGWRPTVVTITEGVIDVTRGGHTERFEVTEPSTSVEFSGRPGSPTWTAALRTRNGPRTILRSSHVKPRQFERIVRHYRATAPDEDVPA